jgi:hypothetical protein
MCFDVMRAREMRRVRVEEGKDEEEEEKREEIEACGHASVIKRAQRSRISPRRWRDRIPQVTVN